MSQCWNFSLSSLFLSLMTTECNSTNVFQERQPEKYALLCQYLSDIASTSYLCLHLCFLNNKHFPFLTKQYSCGILQPLCQRHLVSDASERSGALGAVADELCNGQLYSAWIWLVRFFFQHRTRVTSSLIYQLNSAYVFSLDPHLISTAQFESLI